MLAQRCPNFRLAGRTSGVGLVRGCNTAHRPAFTCWIQGHTGLILSAGSSCVLVPSCTPGPAMCWHELAPGATLSSPQGSPRVQKFDSKGTILPVLPQPPNFQTQGEPWRPGGMFVPSKTAPQARGGLLVQSY